jgi:hypothetical protein
MVGSRPGMAPGSGRGGAAVDLRGIIRGAGRVQRGVWRAFMTFPDCEMTTAELARWAYPRLRGEPQRKHRWAIVRAASRVAERVRRDRPGGVVFRAFGSNPVADCGFADDNCESAQ